MFDVDEVSFLFVVLAAALAAAIVAALPRKQAPPVVVLELLFGIVIGPQVLHWADSDSFIQFFSNLGLGMLFFFAGYEIDLERIRGQPLRLALWGWGISLVLAYSMGGMLAAAGLVLSFLYTGSALATTAIGTLIPILRDTGELSSRFGTQILAAGAIGEFGPIVLVTIVLSTGHPIDEALILVGFVLIAVSLAILSVRVGWRGIPALERTIDASSQLAVRIVVLLVFGLVALAAELGLDLLLGGFVAGMITRTALRGREITQLDSKLTALGFGFLVPFFFVSSGLTFDLDALTSSPQALLNVPIFLGLFLLVRGAPAMLLYRSVLGLRDRFALAFLSATALPLVVAITILAQSTGHMKSSTAAALIGAAILSTLIYPIVGVRLWRRSAEKNPTAERRPAV